MKECIALFPPPGDEESLLICCNSGGLGDSECSISVEFCTNAS